MRIKLNKYFYLDEFVSPHIYNMYGANSIWFVAKPIIEAAFHLRTMFGPTIVNDWYDGGDRMWSGFRDSSCTIGALNSFHKHGKAFDSIYKSADIEDVKKYVINNHKIFNAFGITAMEANSSNWLHLDCRNVSNSNSILLVNG